VEGSLHAINQLNLSSNFDRTLICDRQTDIDNRQRGQRAIASTMLSEHPMVKTKTLGDSRTVKHIKMILCSR